MPWSAWGYQQPFGFASGTVTYIRSTAMPGQTTRNRAAIYARVSTEEQGDNNSIPDQLFVCRKYAQEHHLQVIQEYIDMESGLVGHRKAIDELIVTARQRAFDIVIVKK